MYVIHSACALAGRADYAQDFNRQAFEIGAHAVTPDEAPSPLRRRAPRKSARRDCVVNVRLRPEERERFVDICAQHGVTMSAGVRRLVREATAFGPSLDGASRAEVCQLIAQWQAVGRNLNQIVRAMNAGLVPDSSSVRAGVEECRHLLGGHVAMFGSICAPRFERAGAALRADETQ